MEYEGVFSVYVVCVCICVCVCVYACVFVCVCVCVCVCIHSQMVSSPWAFSTLSVRLCTTVGDTALLYVRTFVSDNYVGSDYVTVNTHLGLHDMFN